jgi:hypothetical protein
MDQDYKLEIIDRDGWVKEQALEKPINYIGSGSRSDIVLEPARGGGVAALHAQLIVSNQGQAAQVSYAAPGDSGCQLVNLSDSDILVAPHLPTNASEGAGLGTAGEQTLSPRSVVNLTDGMVFRLGDFTLIFHGGGQAGADQAAGFARSGQYIGLNVSLPQTRLAPHQSLEGAFKLSWIWRGWSRIATISSRARYWPPVRSERCCSACTIEATSLWPAITTSPSGPAPRAPILAMKCMSLR